MWCPPQPHLGAAADTPGAPATGDQITGETRDAIIKMVYECTKEPSAPVVHRCHTPATGTPAAPAAPALPQDGGESEDTRTIRELREKLTSMNMVFNAEVLMSEVCDGWAEKIQNGKDRTIRELREELQRTRKDLKWAREKLSEVITENLELRRRLFSI
jgi:hypothetical protein